MRIQRIRSAFWTMSALILVLIVAGCGGNPTKPVTSPSSVIVETAVTASTDEPAIDQIATSAPTLELVTDKNVLYQEDFKNSTSGWPEEAYDNYFIGYHEPENYHIQVLSPNYKTLVSTPDKTKYGDITIDLEVYKLGAAEGDFRYGLVFRRSGDQYYAFTISPRTKTWYVLKSSSNALEVLKEGTDDSIQGLDVADTLRVDAKGSTFFFHINDQLVDQVNDPDYVDGEVGLFVQAFDSPGAHIHFDTLTIRNVVDPQPQANILYQEDFKNSTSGWPEEAFDNYFIGYHGPDYYHVQVLSPNYKTLVSTPDKSKYEDVTIDLEVFTEGAADGDFRYGLVFRRSGDQYYAFTISPRTRTWYLLKSSSNALEVLKEGTNDSIQGLDAADMLRVDAKGSTIFLHINDQLVDQINDPDYVDGEVGLYVQAFDSLGAHIHFDTLTILDFKAPALCSVITEGLNVRNGPGESFASPATLMRGDSVEPLGRSVDDGWMLVQIDGSDQQGWVANSEKWLSCIMAFADLPVVEP